ncbi:hypothetical protein O7626_40430 [Micromonospora sp. WMMD1102]|uniref:hypothetical protein n=1 Tax=Micromonospora sp. WMMD1102 TaxID=3016105 RepID=UPI002414DF97|nr:hypothetical protein [Micromonospora sp. WMMD1102]MDG4792086.1 hypothetical protein [Micromonospora sp. WMMD1102]
MPNRNSRPRQNRCAVPAPADHLTAGITLNAVGSIANGQQTYTRDQVSYLVSLAYETGRTHGATEDMAEVVACWAEFAEPRATRQQRTAARLAEMKAGHEREQRRPPNQWMRRVYDDMEWPEVAVPGAVDLNTLNGTWPALAPREAPSASSNGRNSGRRHLRVVA